MPETGFIPWGAVFESGKKYRKLVAQSLLSIFIHFLNFPLPLRQQLPQKSSQHSSDALRSISSTARDGVFVFFSSLIRSARSGAIV